MLQFHSFHPGARSPADWQSDTTEEFRAHHEGVQRRKASLVVPQAQPKILHALHNWQQQQILSKSCTAPPSDASLSRVQWQQWLHKQLADAEFVKPRPMWRVPVTFGCNIGSSNPYCRYWSSYITTHVMPACHFCVMTSTRSKYWLI